jgi:hypothetical protein
LSFERPGDLAKAPLVRSSFSRRILARASSAVGPLANTAVLVRMPCSKPVNIPSSIA